MRPDANPEVLPQNVAALMMPCVHVYTRAAQTKLQLQCLIVLVYRWRIGVTARSLARFFQGGDHFSTVIVDLYFGEDLAHGSVAPNQEGAPLNSHEFSAVERFLFVHAISAGDLVAAIAQQREIKMMLFDELLMGSGTIGTHPDHLSARGAQFPKVVAEAARFGRASRSHI